jgi:hypothetical protein
VTTAEHSVIQVACLSIGLAMTLPAQAGYGFVLTITHPYSLLGDPVKAKLGWVPKVGSAERVREDFKSAERDELIKRHGDKAMDYHE